MKPRKILEQDGLYLDSADHWEMFESKIYRYPRKRNGAVIFTYIPIDIARHLNLKNKDIVLIAIKRKNHE